MFDTIIIGSGPAGVSAAVYLKRANINCLVLTTNNSTLQKVGIIENYYGLTRIDGNKLYNDGLRQLEELNIDVHYEEVLNITKEANFIVTTDKQVYKSKTVIIATGVSRNKNSIKGIKELEGKGVSYCATCDGFFFRNKKIAVLGNGEYALHEIKYLLNLSNNITVLTNGENINPKIKNLQLKYIESKVNKLNEDNILKSIIFDNNYEEEFEGLFVALGVAGSGSFAKTLGIKQERNFLAVNNKFETNIEGLYAIGDCIGGLLQVSKAISDGAQVSVEIIKYIKTK